MASSSCRSPRRARRGWSRRNRLLYFRDLTVGTLDLTESPADSRGALLAGESEAGTPLADLVDEAGRLRAAASLQEIVDGARSNLEERGPNTLFLAAGLASWLPGAVGGTQMHLIASQRYELAEDDVPLGCRT